jgi:hypothetical protein
MATFPETSATRPQYHMRQIHLWNTTYQNPRPGGLPPGRDGNEKGERPELFVFSQNINVKDLGTQIEVNIGKEKLTRFSHYTDIPRNDL